MFVFNCTKAAADFFTVTRKGVKVGPMEAAPSKNIADDAAHLKQADGNTPHLSQWLVHAIKVNRKNCLIAMEINSRYSVTIADLAKGDSEEFLRIFIQRLLENIARYVQAANVISEETNILAIQKFMKTHTAFRFFQRTHRSAQAHINDVAWHFRREVDSICHLPNNEEECANFDAFINQLLRTTQEKKDYFTPYVEITTQWLKNYTNQTEQELELSREALDGLYRPQFETYYMEEDTAPPLASSQETLSPSGNVVNIDDFRNRRRG